MPGAVDFLCVALRALEHALEPLGEQGLFGFKVTLVRTLYFLEIAKVALVLLHRCLRPSWRSAPSSSWSSCQLGAGTTVPQTAAAGAASRRLASERC